MGIEFRDELIAFLQTLPDHLEIKSAINQISLNDPDGIRELALKIMPHKSPKRSKFFKEIFELSSHYNLVDLSETQRLERIRELLNEHLE